MKNNSLLLFWTLIVVASLPIFSKVACAYDNEFVHKAINEKAARRSIINDYVKNNLGYSEGIEKPFSEQRVWWWLREGGYQEDKPDVRVLNHFHDPVYPASNWSNAG